MMLRILFIVLIIVCLSWQDTSTETTDLENVEDTFTEMVLLPKESTTEDNLDEKDVQPISKDAENNDKKAPIVLTFRRLNPHFYGLGGNLEHKLNFRDDITIAIDPTSVDNNSIHHAVSWNNKFNDHCGPRKHCSRRLNLVCRREITDGHMKSGFCACDSKPEDKVEWSKILENCLAPASYNCNSHRTCASGNCSGNVCQPVPKQIHKKGLAISTTPVGFFVTFFFSAFIIRDIFINTSYA